MQKIMNLLRLATDLGFWMHKVSLLPFFLRGLIIWILAIGVGCRSFAKLNLSPDLILFGKISCAITTLILLLLGLEIMIKASDKYIKKKFS